MPHPFSHDICISLGQMGLDSGSSIEMNFVLFIRRVWLPVFDVYALSQHERIWHQESDCDWGMDSYKIEAQRGCKAVTTRRRNEERGGGVRKSERERGGE